MNTCPVYRRSGGHSYQATVPGPIGSILNPARDPHAHASLPFACSLCGSCTDVCPVRINLHEQLLIMRRQRPIQKELSWTKRWAMKAFSWLALHPRLFAGCGWIARQLLLLLPKRLVSNRWNPWTRQRDLPLPPRASFARQYRSYQRQKSRS
jgi:L-lactate dehydrogenase complex protein LldF